MEALTQEEAQVICGLVDTALKATGIQIFGHRQGAVLQSALEKIEGQVLDEAKEDG